MKTNIEKKSVEVYILDNFKKIANGILLPHNLIPFDCMNIIFEAIILIPSYLAIRINQISYTSIHYIFNIAFIHLILQIGVAFYINKEKSYKYQRFITVWSGITLFAFSIISYFLISIIVISNNYDNSILSLIIISIFLGIIILIISIIITVFMSQKGKIKKKNYMPSTRVSQIGVNFLGLVAVGFIARKLSFLGVDSNFIILFVCAIVLQYLFAIFVLPQVIILAYYKFKYKEFIVEMPDILKENLKK